MKFKIRVKSIWEFGQRKDSMGKPHQEDALFPSFKSENDSDRLFILCDGMGGHAKGEVASNTVCEEMSRTILAECPDSNGPFSDAMLQHALINAFKGLDARDTGGEKKMGTTMTFLKFHSAGYTAAHIGDSRIYQFRPGDDGDTTQIVFKSEDHSLVNDLIKIGELTEEEAKTFPQRNVITRAMQPHDERRPKADVHHSADIRPGDYFYLCSDGMLEQADDDNLRFIFSTKIPGIDKKVETLILNSTHNSDNHTGIIIEIVEVEGAPDVPVICKPEECTLLIDKDNDVPIRPLQPIITPTSVNTPAANISRCGFNSPTAQPMNNNGIARSRKKGKTGILVYIMVGLLIALIALIAFLFVNKEKDNERSGSENNYNIENSSTKSSEITPPVETERTDSRIHNHNDYEETAPRHSAPQSRKKIDPANIPGVKKNEKTRTSVTKPSGVPNKTSASPEQTPQGDNKPSDVQQGNNLKKRPINGN